MGGELAELGGFAGAVEALDGEEEAAGHRDRVQRAGSR
jgi:hypothetical protein